MLDNDFNASSHDDDACSTSSEYLKRAVAACSGGDSTLGMYLYLAAFEQGTAAGGTPSEEVLHGIKQAWALACNGKERSLAEYIFEKMEPYLTSGEVAVCADELQSLALDKLEEFGLSRDELQDMAEMISQDVLGIDAHLVKVEHIMDRPLVRRALPSPELLAEDAVAIVKGEASEGERTSDAKEDCGDGCCHGCTGDASDAPDGSDASDKTPETPLEFLSKAAEELNAKLAIAEDPLNYNNLAGYGGTVSIMRELGIGLHDDEGFQSLVSLLNARHGLEGMPALDTLLFRSPAREDANRFASATVGELKLPALRMHMEESLQGLPLLCVTAQADMASKMKSMRTAFENGGVLMLEDIDMWGAPRTDAGDERESFLMMQLSRGAREAINLIRSAVENPDVYVLATAAADTEIDPFFLDLLEPLSVVDIDYPTPEERVEIWMDIARAHPSMRGVNRADLVRYSANMPRYDMYMAAREAVEEAYKVGLMMRKYYAVSRENIFDKLAAYQPLDSREYQELEDAVVRDFRSDLANIDDLLRGE